jgi:hypothetical protein
MPERHSKRTLASSGFAVIEECSCGSIHLTIGAVTLRLPPSALQPLAAALGQAARAQGLHAAPALAEVAS